MDNPISVNKLPFRAMKVIQRALMETAMSAVITIDPPPVRLEAEIMGGLEVTKKLKSPTRVQLLGNICAWYELTKITRDKLPENDLRGGITVLLTELSWIQELIDKVATEKAIVE